MGCAARQGYRTCDVLASISGLRDLIARALHSSGQRQPTVGDLLRHTGRGTVHELPVFVGTPTQVADQMEDWVRGRAYNGFVVAATHMPGAYEDFVRLVVPELQRRGLLPTAYRGCTLRDNLGLPPLLWRAYT